MAWTWPGSASTRPRRRLHRNPHPARADGDSLWAAAHADRREDFPSCRVDSGDRAVTAVRHPDAAQPVRNPDRRAADRHADHRAGVRLDARDAVIAGVGDPDGVEPHRYAARGQPDGVIAAEVAEVRRRIDSGHAAVLLIRDPKGPEAVRSGGRTVAGVRRGDDTPRGGIDPGDA